MPDDLLMPTITDAPQPLRQPWRVDSLVYPAFFGGPLAVTWLGAINAHRLGVDTRRIALIVATGVAAKVAQVAVIVLFLQGMSSSVQRLTYSIAGIVVWGVAQWVQRRPFRIYLLRGGEPASLLGAGIGTVAAAALLEIMITSFLTRG